MWTGAEFYPLISAIFLADKVACSMAQPSGSQLNVLDILSERGLTEFHRLLNGSFALRGLLSNPAPALTLFVPTNEAIDRWRRTNSNTASITSDVLQNHIVPGSWSEDQLRQLALRPNKAQRKLSSGFFNSPLWISSEDSSKKDLRTNLPVLCINGAQLLSSRNTQFDPRVSAPRSFPFIHLLDDILAPTGSEVSAAAFLQDSSLHIYPQLQLQEVGRRIQELSNQVPEFQDSSTVYTFFLPINQAFSLLRNPASFNINVLQSHVIPNQLIFFQSYSNSSRDHNTDRSFPVNSNAQLGFFDNGTTKQVFSNVVQKDSTRFRPGKVYRNIIKSNIPGKQNGNATTSLPIRKDQRIFCSFKWSDSRHRRTIAHRREHRQK
ncbi:hypothetical protein RvY_00449-1 [Ramazzottius varieornatus]|uniref:FAS1 domain-containing protein n=1 Tax=Ramazzottius varieornatus TaxID=947166 RepID=A0A1D1UGG7_RAMVA|nr:hypothetical protein RvY_00449-1 [Ramazzottius varieornatus]